MKKRTNKKGFALVETLVCAVFVCTIFMLLIVNYYPMLGKLQRYQNYDESENKYIAYHLSELIKTIINENKDSFTDDQPVIVWDKSVCDYLSESSWGTDEQCKSFFDISNITKVYYTTYSTQNLKNYVSNNSMENESQNFSRAFELYVKYMPTHVVTNANADKGNDYRRLIIERGIEDIKVVNRDGQNRVVYKYADIEVKVN